MNIFHYCPVCGSNQFHANSPKSKRCAACGFELFMNPSAATAAFIRNERGELLFTVRNREPARGTLDLPGGFSDAGETSEEGVRREVMEETGLRVVSSRFLFSLPNRYLYSGLSIPTLDFFYECLVEDTKPLHADDDAASCAWLRIEEVEPALIGLDSIRCGFVRYREMLRAESAEKQP